MIQEKILNNIPVEGLSGKYKPLQTNKVLERFVSKGWRVNSVQGGGKTGQGKHLIRLRHEGFKIGQDYIEIVVLNSYDGSCSFTISIGIFRLVCSNGLVIGDTIFKAPRLRHIGSGFIERVDDAIEQVEVACTKLSATIDKLKTTTLSNDVLERISVTTMNLRFYGKESPTVEDYTKQGTYRLKTRLGYTIRRSSDATVHNAWHFLNRLQEDVIRGGQTYMHDKQGTRSFRTTKPVTGIDKTLKLNKAIFDLVTQEVA